MNTLKQQVTDTIEDAQLKYEVFLKLDELNENFEQEVKNRITNKLNRLYKGTIFFPESNQAYINLSSESLTENQHKLLQLGTKCHFKTKFDPIIKKLETEILYNSLIKLSQDEIIDISPNLKPQLLAESTKCRDKRPSQIIPKELREAGKQLKQHDSIIVRKADKASVFVVLDKSKYNAKIEHILNDSSKFEALSANPITRLKTRVNSLIHSANRASGTKTFTPITGDYKPGYIYGQVKTHKPGNPLRPIIAQIPTPTYSTAKTLNTMITPFLPAKYQLNSTDNFLQILRAINPQGILASLDVESLFTNVPVLETIDIICNCIYRNSELPPLSVPENILRELLKICTTECPFQNTNGQIFIQKDGVSMGSPLGVSFANFYMTNLENKVFHDQPELKPTIFARYIDDCFLVVESENDITRLIDTFKENSVLNFTHEIGGQRLNFLDVSIENNDGTYKTKVYRKPTDPGIYLNSRSECPESYKTGTIKNLIHRTFKICSDISNCRESINNLKQAFVNNGYSNSLFDKILNKYIDNLPNRQAETSQPPPEPPDGGSNHTHDIYYKNQFSNAYKTDERVMKNIVHSNVKCKNPNDSLKLIIYYKSATVKSLASRNNNSPPIPPLQQTDLIYEFTCKKDECEHLPNNSYVGMTTTTLSRRLTMHLNSGGPKTHLNTTHNENLTRINLENGTKILRKEPDHNRLKILEALIIQEKRPVINQQITGSCRTLLLHCDRIAPFQRAQSNFNARTPAIRNNDPTTSDNPSTPISHSTQNSLPSHQTSPVGEIPANPSSDLPLTQTPRRSQRVQQRINR